MPQPVKTDYFGLVSKYLSPLGPRPASPPRQTPSGGKHGVLGRINAVLSAEPLRNPLFCNVARNFWTGVANVAGTTLNTPTERTMMRRYFGGGGGAYRLSPAEMKAAIDQYRTYGDHVVSGRKFPMANGAYRRNVNFTGSYGADELDGLLGTATGFFDKDDRLTGIRDTFDFDAAPREVGLGNGRLARAANAAASQAVYLAQRDANIFCPGSSNPIRITGGSVR
ncbi:hypothetical protein [Sphingomonas crusticola]|uniref:hypothetical protein n=1 Tax=Sphingomonas crusticola TaxID=1697973 RepID=UPI0013C342B2|nr:hypothetical protein [Sphingomonas crusticola]